MKLVRIVTSDGEVLNGVQNDEGKVFRALGSIEEGFRSTSEALLPKKFLAPVVPVMLWAIGLNYRRHAQETGGVPPERPVVFAKGINAVQNPDDPILLPRTGSGKVDYEAELAVVIGRSCKNVSRERAFEYVAGYTCANDVSARDWQLQWGGTQWSRGKSFDTFAPLGPCLITPESLPDPRRLHISTILNDEIVQDCNTCDMIFDVPTLIEFLSADTTLLPGTVILTGTPHGVGMARRPPRWLVPGDRVSIVIEGIGTLSNPVAAA